MQLRRLGSAVALACALAADVPAQALSLADAMGGTGLASGGLLFSDFQIAFAGTGLSLELEDYDVSPIAGGFSLTGPLLVTPGESGTFVLRYRVDPADPAEAIAGAQLSFDGGVLGVGAAGLVTNGFEDLASASLGSAFVYAIDGVGTLHDASVPFTPAQPGLLVTLMVYLDTGAPGALLAFTGPVDQRFTLVPEAPALALCCLGVGGLVLMGRRRGSPLRRETRGDDAWEEASGVRDATAPDGVSA
jgi:hypothetical protein